MQQEEEIEVKEEMRSSRFTEAIALLFVTIIMAGLFIKIIFY
jgi:hypothetical protein